MLCLLALLGTAAAVYLGVSSHAAQSFTARAVVMYRADAGEAAANGQVDQPRPDSQAIQQEILSDANLEQFARQLGTSAPSDGQPGPPPSEILAMIRDGLSIHSSDSGPGLVEITITFEGQDGDFAARLVNLVAQQYARRLGGTTREEAQQSHQRARLAAEQARGQYVDTRRQLDQFLGDHFQQHEARAERLGPRQTAEGRPASSSPPASAESPPAGPGEVATVDNPEWLAGSAVRAELQKKRAQLLAERTPLHPDVQELDLQLREVDRRLSGIPRRIPASAAGKSADQTAAMPAAMPMADKVETGSSPPPALAIETSQGHAEAAREFQSRRDAVIRAERALEELALQERQAWQRQLEPPAVEIRPADYADAADTVGESRRLLSALVLGVIAAVGVGTLSSGLAGSELPLESPRQVQAALSVPIVGVISDNSEPRRRKPSIAGALLRMFSLLCLLTLLAGCIGMLVVMMNPQGPMVPN